MLSVGLRPLFNGSILLHRFLPVLAVKSGDGDVTNCARIKTVDSNPPAIRVGPRGVKTLHSTHTAESVLCPVCVERVAGKNIFTLYASQ